MNRPPGAVAVLDREPARSDFLSEVLSGLSRRPRTLPCKFFYDERGAALFQQICELPEYYVTRTELAILQQYSSEMAVHLGPRLELVGFGTGAGTKTRILIEQLEQPVAYVPVDISSKQLRNSTALFSQLFPQLEILPVCTDYLQPFNLPTPAIRPARKVVYFPGSTIGNFEPPQAEEFLRRIAELCGAGGGLLIGVDLRKERAVLEAAYNDRAGVTAQFNLNLLARCNAELGADFDLSQWRHRAVYNSDEGRIEMHLVSEREQTVRLHDQEFHFAAGEVIVTEFSYKYAPEGFIELARRAGFAFVKMWSDDARLFGVFYFAL